MAGIVAGATLVSVGLTAAPASAAEKARHQVRVSTAGQQDPGYVTVVGRLVFVDKNTVRVSGVVNDVCPGNGKGGYVSLVVKFRNGTSATRSLGKDDGTCTGPGRYFSHNRSFEGRVKTARVMLREESRPNPREIAVAVTSFWGNPYVG